jgi:hypothetical protein
MRHATTGSFGFLLLLDSGYPVKFAPRILVRVVQWTRRCHLFSHVEHWIDIQWLQWRSMHRYEAWASLAITIKNGLA